MADYTKDEILKVFKTLLGGPTRPVGDEAYDRPCIERLKLQIEVMMALHEEVCMIEHDMYNHHLASKRDAAKICSDYLDWVGVEK